MWEKLAEWDRDLFVWLNNLGIEQYDAFWIFVTQETNWIPLYIIFLLLFYIAFNWKRAILGNFFVLATTAAAYGFTQLVKNQIARLRPNNEPLLEGLIRVLQEPENFSFFSGHSSTSFALTTFVVLALQRRWKWVYVFYIWPLIFVSSRIFVGVHYPADILVGAGVGVLLAFVFYYLYKFILEKLDLV